VLTVMVDIDDDGVDNDSGHGKSSESMGCGLSLLAGTASVHHSWHW